MSAERQERPAAGEAERAAYYDAHRAEVEAWPEVPAPPDAKAPTKRGVVFSVRFTTDEAAAVEQAATARGLTISAFLRSVAQEAADIAPPPVDHVRIADRIIALAEELRSGSQQARRSGAGTGGPRTTTRVPAASSKVLRDARPSKGSKTKTVDSSSTGSETNG